MARQAKRNGNTAEANSDDTDTGEPQMSETDTTGAETPNFDTMSPDQLQIFVEMAIDRMPLDGLSELVRYIQEKQRTRQEDERMRLLEKWREEAARFGMQVRLEPIGQTGRRRKSSGRTVAPKYRGPNGDTWSGRGIPPKWLTALEATGRNREEFRIKEEG